MTLNSVEEIFKMGGEQIYLEARDITLKIINRIGGKIIGDRVMFYGDAVTPVVLKKDDYFTSIKTK